MASSDSRKLYPELGHTSFNPKNAVLWIEQKQASLQDLYAHDIFQELLQSAARPKQSSGNACTKLCGFVEQCSRSQCAALSAYAFSQRTAISLFNFYLEWNERDSHRSMRLVLDFLNFYVEKNPDRKTAATIKERFLKEVVSIITLQSTKPSIKSAITALDHFLTKKLLYLSDALDMYRQVHSIPETEPLSWDAFISKLFTWMDIQYICPIAGKLLVTIFIKPWYPNQDVKFSPESWQRFLFSALNANIELLDSVKIYILIPLFQADRDRSLEYLNHLFNLQGITKDKQILDLDSMIWLATLEAGKKVGCVDEPDSHTSSDEQDDHPASYVRQDVLEDILCHTSYEARSSAVSILVASPSSTKPYTAQTLGLLQKHLPAFHADTDARFRYDVLGHSRNMIARILGSTIALQRDIERKSKKAKADSAKDQESITKLKSTLYYHEEFTEWYVQFLKRELVPTASYQRHITSLRAMEFVLKSGLLDNVQSDKKKLRPYTTLIDTVWVRSVLDLIMDPFDDVRETAASLLKLLLLADTNHPSSPILSGLSNPMLNELREFCTRASNLASKTSRADHSDGVARSYEALSHWTSSRNEKLCIPKKVLEELELKLSAAENDLASAVLDAPIHGSFASLRHVWDALSSDRYTVEELDVLSNIRSRAIACCDRIWRVVRHVLCDDSPEGHLPEDLDETEGLDTKDVLSYSFRAIHESSKLLQNIASNARISGTDQLRLPLDAFDTIGNLTFAQLSNLRHRGAFTSVSQTFTSCCQLSKYFPRSSTDAEHFLNKWYKGALNCIYTQASTTRRSAGIPALIVGILSANADEPSFETVLQNLQAIGRQPAHISETDGSNLPQVHALNCIKDIFKSSYLSKRADLYLTDCLELAASSLKSEVWAIRNCGLLLLRSLMDNLFGTNESKTSMEAGWDGKTTKIAWHKYTSLPALLVNLLSMGRSSIEASSEAQVMTAESVFPALDIIRRAGPPENVKDILYDMVYWYIGSHIWHVREMAARTLCSFLLGEDWFKSMQKLLRESSVSANKVHGALLTFKFLLERLSDVEPDKLFKHYPDDLAGLLDEVIQADGSIRTSLEARAVLFEIIGFLISLPDRERSNENNTSRQVSPIHLKNLEGVFLASFKRYPSSALMESKKAESACLYALQASSSRSSTLNEYIHSLVSKDVNVTCDALEALLVDAESGVSLHSLAVASQIVRACMVVILEMQNPEPRRLAVEIIAIHLERVLSTDGPKEIPPLEELQIVWSDLNSKALNPGLADAVLRASGCILATIVSATKASLDPTTEQWLRSWGVMMSNAGFDDNGFDTRMAAALAIRSFTTHVAINTTLPCHIPWLLALYDALNDDDDEIRDVAAAAAFPLLGKSLISFEAAMRLLSWLTQHYGHLDEFRQHVAHRMVVGRAAAGVAVVSDPWVSPETQLTEALCFDDSLFVIEEQNLYIDEVREAQRWMRVLIGCGGAAAAATAAAPDALVSWTASGLRTLTELAASDDGVLGWSSKPEVFAICSRIVISGAALAKHHLVVKEELQRFLDQGKQTRLHGLLIAMCAS
ncbi:putative death-receptor fusion protein-domain-containing protein [Xylariales sp. PMI_506]|nr:putative death-receptor fusion protein-domain-containing protein [Xylariales sp. PMI_506]